MKNQNEIKTELRYYADDAGKTITFLVPTNINDKNYDRIHREIGRIQWFVKGFGGAKNPDQTMTFSFESEEYVCVQRYLNKFEWKKVDKLVIPPQCLLCPNAPGTGV